MSVARFVIALLLSLTLLAFAAQFMIDFSSINIATSCIVVLNTIFLLYSLSGQITKSDPSPNFSEENSIYSNSFHLYFLLYFSELPTITKFTFLL